jgi:hypothetical protein
MRSTINLDIQRASIASGAAFTKRDLEQRFKQYQSYLAGSFPVSDRGEIDQGELFKYTKASMENFSRMELPGKTIPTELIRYIATSNGGRGVDIRIPEVGVFSEVASQLGGTAVLSSAKEIFKGTGFNVPQGVEGIGMMAVNDILSGKPIGKSVGKAISTGVGTLAGAKVGMIIGTGVPLIGNVVGAAVGAIVSTMINQVFAKPPPLPPPPINVKMLEAARQAEVDQEKFNRLNQVRESALNSCRSAEAKYWSDFDESVYMLSRELTRMELEAGFKFKLRWFDDTHGPAFYADPQKLARIGASWAYQYERNPIDLDNTPSAIREGSRSQNFFTYLDNDNLLTNCRLSTMGCPYPDMYPVVNYPGRSKFGEDGRYGTFNTMNIVRAFAARDVVWVPENMRVDCERYISYPTHASFMTQQGAITYGQYLKGLSDDQIVKALRLGVAEKLVSADLARTATIYNSYLRIVSGEAAFGNGKFKASDIDPGFEKVEKANALFNNSALAAGIGLFGFSVWRALK